MFKQFESTIEGDFTSGCQIVCAMFDEDLERLYVDVRMLRLERPALTSFGRNDFYNFATEFEMELEYLDESDLAEVESLCLKMNKSYYDENVDLSARSVESYVKKEYRSVAGSFADLDVIVAIQPDDFITFDELLALKEEYDLTD